MPGTYFVNGKKLCELRDQLAKQEGGKVTQQEIANRAEIAKNTYQKMESRSDERFDIDTIEKVAITFGLLAHEIVRDRSEELDFGDFELIDLRSISSVNANEWEKQRLKVSLLPLTLISTSDVPVTVKSVEIGFNDFSSDTFFWRSEANIVAGGVPHDDINLNRAIYGVELAPGEEWKREVQFFNKSSLGVTWKEFHDLVESKNEPSLKFTIKMSSNVGVIEKNVLFSLDVLRGYISEKRRRLKNPEAILAFAQPKVTII